LAMKICQPKELHQKWQLGTAAGEKKLLGEKKKTSPRGRGETKRSKVPKLKGSHCGKKKKMYLYVLTEKREKTHGGGNLVTGGKRTGRGAQKGGPIPEKKAEEKSPKSEKRERGSRFSEPKEGKSVDQQAIMYS